MTAKNNYIMISCIVSPTAQVFKVTCNVLFKI